MEQQGSEISIPVIWRNNKYAVEITSDATLKEFGDELLRLTKVRPDTMRLIVPQFSDNNSKLLSPFTDEHSLLSLRDSSVLHAKSIRMMGALEAEVDEVVKSAKSDLRIAGFDEEEKRMMQRMMSGSHQYLKLPQGAYIFGGFCTLQLPGIELNPPPSEALKRMHKLAADPGIVAIMNKHRWRVGIMTEMAPVGYVGVSPKCILGFNKNQGEEISLRLRTDDLKGFRKYESIKKTLLHELAHMIYSEHDANFYALDKQLNQEAERLDWTRSGSHTLSGFSYSIRNEDEFDSGEGSRMSQKLGGNSPHPFSSARSSSVAAAYSRLENAHINSLKLSEAHEEPDPDDSGYDLHGDLGFVDAMNDEKTIIESAHDPCPETEIHSSSQNLCEPNPDDHGVGDIKDTDGINNAEKISKHNVMSKLADPDDSESHLSNFSSELSQNNGHMINEPYDSRTTDILRDEPDPDNEELRRIHDPVAVLCDRLKNAIEVLLSEVSPAETSTVLQTLFKIIRNVIEHPNEIKFKRLRKANPIIQRSVANHKAAMEFLFLIGFNEDVASDETYLVLKRNDPGLLWLAKSLFETYIA